MPNQNPDQNLFASTHLAVNESVLYHLKCGLAFINASLYCLANSVYFCFWSPSRAAHHSPRILVMDLFSKCGYFDLTTDRCRLQNIKNAFIGRFCCCEELLKVLTWDCTLEPLAPPRVAATTAVAVVILLLQLLVLLLLVLPVVVVVVEVLQEVLVPTVVEAAVEVVTGIPVMPVLVAFDDDAADDPSLH